MEKKKYVALEVSFIDLRIEERLAMCGLVWTTPNPTTHNCTARVDASAS